MQDESEVFARRLQMAGATVVFDGSEGMPHCFAVVPWTQRGFSALGRWGTFCRDPAVCKASASWTNKSGERMEVHLFELGMSGGRNLDDVTVKELMARQRKRRVILEQCLVEQWRMES
jgi:hypothetical protein